MRQPKFQTAIEKKELVDDAIADFRMAEHVRLVHNGSTVDVNLFWDRSVRAWSCETCNAARG